MGRHTMKRTVGAVVAGLAISSLGLVAMPAGAGAPMRGMQAGPKFSVERTEHDFGKILDEANVHTTFKFTNSGDATLVISQVKGSCSCTVPALEKTEYAPGESGEISVTFDPRNRRGVQQRTVTVLSNDPVSPSFNMNITANVRPAIDIDPPMARFGEVQRGETQTMMVDITGVAPNFDIVEVTVNRGEGLSVENLGMEELTVDNDPVRRGTLLFTLSGDAAIGQFQGQVTVSLRSGTGNPDDLVQKVITVMAEVVGEVAFIPNRMNLGLVQPQAAFERQIRVNSRTGKAFQIIGVEERPFLGPDGQPNPAQLAGLKFRAEPAEPGREDSYILTISGALPEGVTGVTTDVMVLTNLPDEERVPLRVTGRVRQAPTPGLVPGQPLPPANPHAGHGHEPAKGPDTGPAGPAQQPSLAPTPGKRVPGKKDDE
ncbi:MAG: DUF1573 domain-containing protein [Phycisphaerales bacterium]|nr:DUF1573 domain-containing protein [Phycisphaerales bacterium]